MLKKKLIVSILAMAFFLVAILIGSRMLRSEPEDESKLSKEGVEEVDFSPISETGENESELQAKYSSDKFQAGMNILIYGHPDMMEARNVFDRISSLGVNSIAINFPFYQSSWQASEVSTSPENTPTISELEEIIEIAHNSGLSVMIRPIMDEQAFLSSNRWRGQIQPKDPDSWFDSYQSLLLSYASLAEASDVKSLNIGTELNSMQNKYQVRWVELIENIRGVYKGELLYSFNYDTVSEIPSIEFVKMLDHVGIDAYFSLDLPDNATVEMLQDEWDKQMDQLEETLWQQSIIVTEAGILPIAGAYRTPYAWDFPNGIYDPQAQVNYYEATYNTWKPHVNGIYWWAVVLGQDPAEIGFSPLGLPTEEVIKKHFLQDGK